MYILLAIIAGAVIGAGVHLGVKDRAARGVLLSGAVGAASAAVLYAACTWLGLGEANVWTWVISIAGSAVLALGVTVAVTRTRLAHDARERVRLGIG